MEQTTKFRFKNYIITHTQVNINPYEEISKNIRLDIHRVLEDELDNMYCLTLHAKIWNKEDNLIIRLTIRGNFEYDPEVTDEEKNIYFKHNAPAILMPYIRAYVSSITSLSGIPTIVLPTYTFLV